MRSIPEPPLPGEALDRRHTAARKVQGKHEAYIGRDVVPMWVADMDFAAPQPVVDAVVERAKHGIYGYTDPPAELTSTLIGRLQTQYGCRAVDIDRSWFRWLPGLLPGLHHAVRATCATGGDRVVILTPIYPPFLAS